MGEKNRYTGVVDDSRKQGVNFPGAWRKFIPGLTASHLVMSPLSAAPCSASGPLSSVFWSANQAPAPS